MTELCVKNAVIAILSKDVQYMIIGQRPKSRFVKANMNAKVAKLSLMDFLRFSQIYNNLKNVSYINIPVSPKIMQCTYLEKTLIVVHKNLIVQIFLGPSNNVLILRTENLNYRMDKCKNILVHIFLIVLLRFQKTWNIENGKKLKFISMKHLYKNLKVHIGLSVLREVTTVGKVRALVTKL